MQVGDRKPYGEHALHRHQNYFYLSSVQCAIKFNGKLKPRSSKPLLRQRVSYYCFVNFSFLSILKSRITVIFVCCYLPSDYEINIYSITGKENAIYVQWLSCKLLI